VRQRRVAVWFGLMLLGGFGFGLFAERRPFGDDVFARPFVLFYVFVGVGLVVLRVAAARPVPELLSERALLAGCLVGALAFLAGNYVGVHILQLGAA